MAVYGVSRTVTKLTLFAARAAAFSPARTTHLALYRRRRTNRTAGGRIIDSVISFRFTEYERPSKRRTLLSAVRFVYLYMCRFTASRIDETRASIFFVRIRVRFATIDETGRSKTPSKTFAPGPKFRYSERVRETFGRTFYVSEL